MLRNLTGSLFLLMCTVVVCCVVYPFVMWTIGQTFFPFQANGCLARSGGGRVVGSYLIAQSFTADEYFHPRPSAAAYDASASASSALAPSNLALRDRVVQSLGSMVRYSTGQPVAADLEKWFQADTYQGQPHLVAQWAVRHPAPAQAWLADSAHAEAVGGSTDAVAFFTQFSRQHPGCFPTVAKGVLCPVREGPDIQSLFFEMWLEDHPQVSLQDIPADLVTTSASGLDPHITRQSADLQVDRVASAWAARTGREPTALKEDIQALLQAKTSAPLGGLLGESLVNVLDVNLELRTRYGGVKP